MLDKDYREEEVRSLADGREIKFVKQPSKMSAYNIASTVSVPADSTLVLVSRDTTIYLMEGDTFQMSASAASDLEIVASYEEIS